MLKIEALNDQVIVALGPAAPAKSAGGLYLPDSAKEEMETPTGEVVAVGSDVEYVNVGNLVLLPKLTVNLSTGQTAYMPNRGGVRLCYEGVEYLAFREYELVGLVVDDREVEDGPHSFGG